MKLLTVNDFLLLCTCLKVILIYFTYGISLNKHLPWRRTPPPLQLSNTISVADGYPAAHPLYFTLTTGSLFSSCSLRINAVLFFLWRLWNDQALLIQLLYISSQKDMQIKHWYFKKWKRKENSFIEICTTNNKLLFSIQLHVLKDNIFDASPFIKTDVKKLHRKLILSIWITMRTNW